MDNKAILERVKDEYAKEHGWLNFAHFKIGYHGNLGEEVELAIYELYYQAKLKQLAPSDEEDFICDLMNHLPSYLNQGLSLRIAIKKHRDKFINPEK